MTFVFILKEWSTIYDKYLTVQRVKSKIAIHKKTYNQFKKQKIKINLYQIQDANLYSCLSTTVNS